MATFETDLSRTFGVIRGQGAARDTVVASAIVALATTQIDNADDDVGLFYVPAGAVIIAAGIAATDMDTNGSPALAIDVGDSGDEDRIFAASAVGQAGTASFAMARTGMLYKYAAKTQLRAYIQTASATAAAGTLYVWVQYFVDPEFSTTALTAS